MIGLEGQRIPAPRAGRIFAHLPWALLCGGALAWTAWIPPDRMPVLVCPFLRVTTLPCPACGITRVFHDAGNGRWREAAVRNLPAFLAWFACWAGFLFHGAALIGRRQWTPRRTAERKIRRLVLGLGLALILVFWGIQISREKNRSGETRANESRR